MDAAKQLNLSKNGAAYCQYILKKSLIYKDLWTLKPLIQLNVYSITFALDLMRSHLCLGQSEYRLLILIWDVIPAILYDLRNVQCDEFFVW